MFDSQKNKRDGEKNIKENNSHVWLSKDNIKENQI